MAQRWSVWKAALFGCIPAGYLVFRHFTGDVARSYEPQTLGGEVGYWLGYAGIWPLAFVVVALIRNAFVPKRDTPERKPTALRNFIWPVSLKAEPSGVARFGRVLHWLFALMALAFVVGGAYTLLVASDAGLGLGLIAFGGGGCLLIGRGLRYIFSGE
ncbi:hypothetical protein U91I_01197 [alpha proteobacterium U9-1i]|nr:hypothetical protein U91I_01197 [alpha proteobacterium U9-1i]